MKLDFFNFANLYEPTKKNENFEYKRGHTLNLTNSNVSLVDFNALSTFMFSNNQDANGYVKGYELTEVGMVTIMVHEFIHANDIDSHDDMVSKRTDIKNAILEYSKSTEGRIIVDDKQAELLSWVGLEDTEEWESTFNTEDKKQTYFEQLTKAMYNTKETEMKSKDYDKLMNSTPEEKR